MNRVIYILFSMLITLIISCDSNTKTKPQQPETPIKTPETVIKPKKATKSKTILFFGNSLTAGYGIDPVDAFVGLIEKRIDSLNLDYRVINAGISGDKTAGGFSRVDWILDQQRVDIFILELGGNDALQGVDPASSEKNLQGIIDKVKAKYPATKIVLAGMEAPPNMGDDYTGKFRAMYPRLAKTNKLALIPFILDKVGGVPELNLKDGIHPTEEGHQIVAENIWTILKPLL